MNLRLFSHDDPAHLRAAELLPWFANDSLDATERSAVEQHLNECLACTQEFGELQKLRAALLEDDPAVAAGLARIAPRLGAPAARGRWWQSPASRWRRFRLGATPGWVAAALGSVIAVQAVLLVALAALALRADPVAPYHVLGAAPPTGAQYGEIVVVFDATRPLAEIRRSIENVDGGISAGPTPEGAYTLRIPLAQFDAALPQLQHDPAVAFAQPVVR